MAYRRTSKTTGGIRRTITSNNKGGTTTSSSFKNGNVRITQSYNTKTGQSKTTRTTDTNGWIDKRTDPKYKPVRAKSSRRRSTKSKPMSTKAALWILGICLLIAAISSLH